MITYILHLDAYKVHKDVVELLITNGAICEAFDNVSFPYCTLQEASSQYRNIKSVYLLRSIYKLTLT